MMKLISAILLLVSVGATGAQSPCGPNDAACQMSQGGDALLQHRTSMVQKQKIEASETGKDAQKTTLPHVLLIMTDDLGSGDLPAWAGEDTVVKSPEIDKLIANGVALDRYYTQSSCTPSRAALMTGRYPIRYGLQTIVILPIKGFGLALDETTMANVFKKAGYSTHAIGKWHLGFHTWDYSPSFRGFDTWFGISHGEGNHYNFTWDLSATMGPFGDLFRQTSANCGGDCVNILSKGHDQAKAHGYSSQAWSDEAASIIKKHDLSKPLFIFMAYTAPHAPCQLPLEGTSGQYDEIMKISPQRGIYAEMVSGVDRSIATVTEALKAKGIFDDTILVFTNDNGAPLFASRDFPIGVGSQKCGGERLGEYGQDTGGSNYPLIGGKGSSYEGGVLGVSFIHYPNGGLTPGRFGGLAHVSDWLPTLMSAAGIKEDTDRIKYPLDGVDLWQALKDNSASPRAEVLLDMDHNHAGFGGAFLRNYTKLFLGAWFNHHAYSQIPPEVALRDGISKEEDPKYIEGFKCPEGCVVDLLADPREEHPSTTSSEIESLVKEYRKLEKAAVPNLFEQVPADYRAIVSLKKSGITWPWLDEKFPEPPAN